jgi:GTP-binding protein EngB required for normal cell division
MCVSENCLRIFRLFLKITQNFGYRGADCATFCLVCLNCRLVLHIYAVDTTSPTRWNEFAFLKCIHHSKFDRIVMKTKQKIQQKQRNNNVKNTNRLIDIELNEYIVHLAEVHLLIGMFSIAA